MASIYVGNLPYTATEDEVRQLFEEHGAVDAVRLLTDRETGRPRGFGFVDMPDSAASATAIQSLNGQEFQGRTLRINEARERSPRPGD
jgi:RNA recognition motif-containing protein